MSYRPTAATICMKHIDKDIMKCSLYQKMKGYCDKNEYLGEKVKFKDQNKK